MQGRTLANTSSQLSGKDLKEQQRAAWTRAGCLALSILLLFYLAWLPLSRLHKDIERRRVLESQLREYQRTGQAPRADLHDPRLREGWERLKSEGLLSQFECRLVGRDDSCDTFEVIFSNGEVYRCAVFDWGDGSSKVVGWERVPPVAEGGVPNEAPSAPARRRATKAASG